MGIGHVTIQLEVEDGCEGCDDARETATAPRGATRLTTGISDTAIKGGGAHFRISCGIRRRCLYMRRGGPGSGPHPF